jgi:glycosyltransferase involved in cell wall biosynthesis
VCHFNYSQATEFREKGELTDEKTLYRIMMLEKDIFERVDGVIYVSNWMRDVMENERRICPVSSTVIWNGLPVSVQDTGVSRDDLSLSHQDLVFVNVGTLEPRKNQLGLVKFFAVLAAEYPHVRLLLVGDGPQRLEVERCVTRLQLSDRVKLLGARSDVPALLRLSDLYVHYATSESCSITLLEAARAGLPIAAVPLGGTPEVLAGLGGGIELPGDDIDLAIARIRPYIEQHTLRKELGVRMHSYFTSIFTLDMMVSSYLRATRFLDPMIDQEESLIAT